MDILKEEISLRILCSACLCIGSQLYRVTDEKLKQYYLGALNEIPLYNMPTASPVVCLDCRGLLRRSYEFREQVKDSHRILMTYTSENLTECLLTDVSRPPRLKIQSNDSINIEPQIPSEKSVLKKHKKWKRDSRGTRSQRNDDQSEAIQALSGSSSPHHSQVGPALRGTQEVYVKEELKIECYDSDRDTDYDIPLGDLKQVDTLADIDTELTAIITADTGPIKKKKEVRKKIGKLKKKQKKNGERHNDQSEAIPALSGSSSPHHSEVGPALRGTQEVYVKDELKIECYDSNRDTDYDIPLGDLKQVDTLADIDTELTAIITTDTGPIKKKKEVRKKIGKLKKKQKKNGEKVDIPNIVTIHMTHEEMVEERRKESNRDSYTNAEFKCESCILGFNYMKSYKKHLLARHSPSIGKYTCPICKTVLTTVESFSTHYKRHMKRYECSICQKRTIDLKSMQQHYYSTHEISLKQYKCSDCGKISNSVDSHRYHTDTHKSRLQCPDCDKTFRHRGGLLNHKLTVHEARNKFPCTHCGKVFRWKNSLKRHLPVHDEKNKPESSWQCCLCRVSFASLGSYKRHMKNSLRHVSKEHLRFICDDCDRRFADKTKLRDHIEEKHLHRTYQCKICLKVFMNRVNLDQHIRNVHKGRPNNKMCHHCGKGFPTKAQLESHIRTHTGERPFICELCPTTFSQHSNLYKHTRQVHLNMKSKRYPAVKKRKEDQIQMTLEPTDLPMDYPVDIEFNM